MNRNEIIYLHSLCCKSFTRNWAMRTILWRKIVETSIFVELMAPIQIYSFCFIVKVVMRPLKPISDHLHGVCTQKCDKWGEPLMIWKQRLSRKAYKIVWILWSKIWLYVEFYYMLFQIIFFWVRCCVVCRFISTSSEEAAASIFCHLWN
jgi:hypothetical protein